jgi:hypothetical protein
MFMDEEKLTGTQKAVAGRHAYFPINWPNKKFCDSPFNILLLLRLLCY